MIWYNPFEGKTEDMKVDSRMEKMLVCAAAAAIGLAANAATPCAIGLPADPGEVASYAAAEIRDYVKKATGESWTVVTNAPVGRGVAFRFVEDRRIGEDGFRLREQGGVLTIEASKKRGCLYGAYEYLERFAGVRWYSSDTERVPKLAKIDVPKGFQLESKPDFLMRDAHWYDIAHDGDFAARMRNNANAPLQAKHGGLPYRFGRGVWACHTFCRLMPSDEFFVKHPEYYGLRNGKRSGENQLCLTNPDVLRIVTERIKDRIRKDPGARFYGVSQDDHQNYCECENCAKVDAEEGSHAGCIVRFVNAVAEAVEKEYPDAIIETLAYNYSRFPTKKTKFRHNVTPCVCSIECGFGPDPIEKGTTEFNRQFIKCLEGWGRQTEEIYLWDYTTNFKDYYHFMPNLNVLQDNLRFFRKNGVKYMFEQGNTQGRHGFMAEMKTYLLSKWMWNADLDAETLVKDFTDGYYGAGGKYVRQFLAELEAYFADYCRKHPDFSALIYEEATAGVYDEQFIRRAEALWQQAEDAARKSGDAIALRNVRAGRMSTAFERFVKTPSEATAVALDALATECKSRRWSEGGARTSEYELKLQKLLPGARAWEVPGWDLVWQDEFNGTSVDGSNWHHEHGFVRNKELQYYTKDRRENCRVENGCLVLEARKEKYVDPETDEKAEYTSASLKSDWRFTFMYGRVDVRAKVPAGLGVWPAAWTLGADIKTQRWPWCGEIDIMEYVGHTPKRVWGTAHWSDKTVKTADGHKSSGGHLDLPAPLSDDFHVYSMTWDKEKITFSIDGRQYHEVKLADMQPNVRDWPPFGQYHYLLLNLAYGGTWGGQKGVDDGCLPAKYLVDYVRVYKPLK